MKDVNTMSWKIATLYNFTPVENLEKLQQQLIDECNSENICGIILIAPEGMNCTIAGRDENLENFLPGFADIFDVDHNDIKYSRADYRPFMRMKVKIKKEIITLRSPDADPNRETGTYVNPKDWNDLISDPEITLVDTRNDYEVRLGVFEDAIDPKLGTFTDFKKYVDERLDPEKHKKIAMYCTGGIRCEKASSYMLARGFEEIYQLKGGILRYLEEVPEAESKWKGDCFVFDKRVAVGHDLEKTKEWLVCYGCRMPLHISEAESPEYEYGVSCPGCHENLTPAHVQTLRNRAKIIAEREAELQAEGMW